MPEICKICGKRLSGLETARVGQDEWTCEACRAKLQVENAVRLRPAGKEPFLRFPQPHRKAGRGGSSANVKPAAADALTAQQTPAKGTEVLPATLGAIALVLGLLGLAAVVLGILGFPIFLFFALAAGKVFGLMYVPIGFGLATIAYIIARLGLRGRLKKQPGSLPLKIARSLAEIAIATVLGVIVLLLISAIIHAYW